MQSSTLQLAQVETLIDGVRRQVGILRSQLRPINRLPPELLVHVFGYLGGGACLVPASHVCQKWRHVTLSTPTLWTVIREDDDAIAALCFLERSRNMPLDFAFSIYMRHGGAPEDYYRYDGDRHYDPYDDDDSDNDDDDDDDDDNNNNSSFAVFRTIVKPHAARVRRLHMHVYGDRAYDFYALLAKHDRDRPLPSLEHFSIRMSEYGFRDDSRDGVLPPQSFFASSRLLRQLTFRACLPLDTHLSPSIRSLTLAERAFDLDALLACLAAAPNLEYLALLNSVPHTYECAPRTPVALRRLRELHWFQVWVIDNIFGTVKFFEHLDAPELDTTRFVLLLDPTKYAAMDLYPPCRRAATPFGPVTELHLEASHFTPGKPARNNLVFHGRRAGETLFSVRLHRGSLDALCSAPYATAPSPPPDPDGSPGLALASSLRVDVAHLTQLTLSSATPYDWSRFFCHPDAWPRFLRAIPAVKVLRLRIVQPIQIIAAIAAADERVAPSRLLPNLRVIHLFRPPPPPPHSPKTTEAMSPAAVGSSSMCDGDDGQILLRFLQHRVDLGNPIENIVCSAEDAAALPPEALSLVDSVEVGHSDSWGAEPLFPKSMLPLLEEHLD